MNFLNLVNSFHAPTCIISVEKLPDGGYGEIRLVAGNDKFIAPIEHPAFVAPTNMPGLPDIFQTSNKFIPNSLYYKFLPKDIGFEDICYRSAIKKMPIHTYVHLNDIDIWFDIFSLPIDYESGNICYCSYTVTPCDNSDIGISSSQAGTCSEDVIKTCIKLHNTNDFNKSINEVIHDIRLICRAETCTIVTRERNTEQYSVLASSIMKKRNVMDISKFQNFDEITSSWLNLLYGKDCLIIKDEKDIEYISSVDHQWYYSIVKAGIDSLMLFPLRYNNDVLGFICATNFDTNNIMRIKEALELTTFFISSKLSGYRMIEDIKHISHTDQLTGIPNRLACSELIEQLIKKREKFTVVSVDIDSFKNINDTMGFDVGNKVLSQIAERWKMIADSKLFSTQDHIFRVGNDEFAIIIRDHRSDEEILRTIKQYESILSSRMTFNDRDLYITASFGYALFPDDAQSSDSLFSYANAAMNEVKKLGSSEHILHFTSELFSR